MGVVLEADTFSFVQIAYIKAFQQIKYMDNGISYLIVLLLNTVINIRFFGGMPVKTVAFPHFLIQPYLQLPKISSFFDAKPSFILNDHTYAGVQNIADPIVDKVFGFCPVLFDVL